MFISKNSSRKYKDSIQLNELEESVKDIAGILTNIVFIGKEKRKTCIYFNYAEGLCNYLKLDHFIPTLKVMQDGNYFKVMVIFHPEVCAVCPFWIKKE